MIHAKVGHLRKAFQRHRQAAGAQTPSHVLLLFYAVECGLKAAWLSRNRLKDTSAFEPQLKNRGHDLVFWTRQLNLPAMVTQSRASFRLKDGGARLGIEFAHEAWRYGVDVEPADEVELERWLQQVSEWVKSELNL